MLLWFSYLISSRPHIESLKTTGRASDNDRFFHMMSPCEVGTDCTDCGVLVGRYGMNLFIVASRGAWYYFCLFILIALLTVIFCGEQKSTTILQIILYLRRHKREDGIFIYVYERYSCSNPWPYSGCAIILSLLHVPAMWHLPQFAGRDRWYLPEHVQARTGWLLRRPSRC